MWNICKFGHSLQKVSIPFEINVSFNNMKRLWQGCFIVCKSNSEFCYMCIYDHWRSEVWNITSSTWFTTLLTQWAMRQKSLAGGLLKVIFAVKECAARTYWDCQRLWYEHFEPLKFLPNRIMVCVKLESDDTRLCRLNGVALSSQVCTTSVGLKPLHIVFIRCL